MIDVQLVIISHPTISNTQSHGPKQKDAIPGADVDDAGGKSACHLVTSSTTSSSSVDYNKISSNDTANAASKEVVSFSFSGFRGVLRGLEGSR